MLAAARPPLLSSCAAVVLGFAGTFSQADDRGTSPTDLLGNSSPASRNGAPGASLQDPYFETRAEFLVTLSRIQSGDSPNGQDDSESLRAYPLHPYLEAARLGKALADAAGSADAATHRFLDERAGQPVARELSRAWLESLARREQWQALLDALEHTGGHGANQALRCLALHARVQLGDIAGVAPEIVATWLTANQLPLECEPLFKWLRAEGPLTDELIEQRIVLLLENNQPAFARIIAQRLPTDRAEPLLKWAELLEQPQRSIDRLIAAPSFKLPPDALYSGWQRLSRNDPAAALERYEPLMAALEIDRPQAGRFALALALGLAWDRRSEALEYFALVEPGDVDDYALAWLTRAALWAGEWAAAADAITRMSSEQRNETRWRYWAARAAERLGERARAREVYRSILPKDNYYSAMAAAHLDEAVKPHQEKLDVDAERVRRLAEEPAFVRARELQYARLPWHAAAEWRHGSADLDERGRDQSIHLAASWGWYDLAIATATGQRVFDDYSLLYPRPYDEAVSSAAKLTKLDSSLIYGVIRQESLYRADAASAAGAVGLAQLLPDTAKRAARRWDLPVPQYADLFAPEVNVRLGAAELRGLIDGFGGQIEVGLAGYNAGPNAARRWLPDRPLDSDIWIENIPYNETRNYVQRVLWHSLVFAWLESGEPRSTEAWIARVQPVDAESELHAER